MKRKKKDLLKLPVRDVTVEAIYDSVLLVPTGKKHDSGFMMIAVIGCIGGVAQEIAVTYDDIQWETPEPYHYGKYQLADLRMDMMYPSGVLQVWGDGKFKIEAGYRSYTIAFIRNERDFGKMVK
jgi:hypothetical protein